MLVTEIKAIKTQTHPGMSLVPNAWPGALVILIVLISVISQNVS